MNKIPLATALLAAGLLAGCTSDPLSLPPLGSLVQHPTLAYSDCIEYDAAFPAPEGTFDLPEGFTAIPYQEGTPTETLLVWGNHCGSAALGGQPLEGSGELWGFVLVAPPEHLADGTDGFAFLALGVFTTDERAAAEYASWGLANASSVGAVTVASSGGSSYALGRAYGSDGNLTVATTVSAYGLSTFHDGGSIRVFLWDGKNVTGAFDNVYTSYRSLYHSGPAVFEESVGMPMGLPNLVRPGQGSPAFAFSYENRHVALDLETPAEGAEPTPVTGLAGERFAHGFFA